MNGVRRAGLAAWPVLGLVLLGSACSLGSTSNHERNVSGAKAAQLFLRAAERYRAKERPIIQRAEEIAFEQRRSCRLGTSPDQMLETRISGVVFVYRDILWRKLAVDEHRRFARELEVVPTDNKALRTVAASIGVLDREFTKLERTDVDVCPTLQEWKRRGWSKAYEYRIGEEAYDFGRFGLDTQALDAAGRKALALPTKLEGLGLTEEQARAVLLLMIY